ncbi:hypothetical protein QAD02_002729 [Eretmocerus hayati]|uniref:Uncharacterized protein n=1 Tax=Eretmocerus hayati TaxID=131215 RepID=A0ACC2NJQ9_9HYME|nr:hypothetical protein QAD02_002729 [Eretmocerus hayati]
MEEEIQIMKDKVAGGLQDVNDRLDKLERAANQPAQGDSLDAIVSEVQDRNSRLNNLIMYNIPENSNQDPSLDLQAVKNNLKKIKDFRLGNISVRRIGSGEGSDKPRPLLVVMNSRADVMKVLGNKRFLPKNVAVSTDKTKAQREKLNAVRAEMERINDAHGSRCKTIKYIGGTPTIVDYKEHPAQASTTTSNRAANNELSNSGGASTSSGKGN